MAADLLQDVSVRPCVRFYQGSVRISVPGQPIRTDLRQGERSVSLQATPLEPAPPSAVGFEVEVRGWTSEGYLIVPAALYAGNRFRANASAYPCLLDDPSDWRADVPNTISDVPRLQLTPPSRVQILAGDTACPLVGIAWNGRTLWIGWDPQTDLAHAGVEVEETNDGRLFLRFLSPGVREGTRYHAGPTWPESEDRGRVLTGPLELKLRYWASQGGTDDLLLQYPSVRKAWAGPYHAPEGESLQAAATRVAEKYNRVNWSEHGYYAVGDRTVPYSDWQMGWVGGGISAYAMAHMGSPERALRNLEFACEEGISPSGLFWSLFEQGRWFGDMIDMPYGDDWHLIRRSGDGLYFLAKLARESGIAPEGLRTVAGALASLWERNGQYGQFVSDRTGEIRVGGTASGGIVPTALLEAHRLFGQDRWLQIARDSLRQMDRDYLKEGYTSGGPGEAAQCPDSESAFAILESAVALWEFDGSDEWKDLADRAYALSLTWVSAFDHPFPAESALGSLGVKSRGSVWANVQNKHAAPGICTLGGGTLRKLGPGPAEVFHEIASFIPQAVSATDRPVFGMPDGYICERVNTSDWEAPEVGVGEGFPASCWCEVAAMLSAIDERQSPTQIAVE